MKKHKPQKISIKKLTIAKLNLNSMKKIDGGTSVLTSQYSEMNGIPVPYCFYEK